MESHFNGRATSRLVDGVRVTGIWASTKPAGQGPRYCGVMQTIADHDWSECLRQRDLAIGYAKGADELRRWMKLTRGNLRAALDGHACGWHGVQHHCNGYSTRVMAYAKRLGWIAPSPAGGQRTR